MPIIKKKVWPEVFKLVKFEENLRRDPRLYQDFHALIVIDGKSWK